MSNSYRDEFESFFILEKTCTPQYKQFEILGSTHLEVRS